MQADNGFARAALARQLEEMTRRLAEAQAEIERLTNALAEADRHAVRIEALLEPHIKWEADRLAHHERLERTLDRRRPARSPKDAP